MSTANTAIQWTDATWNPVRGCSRVSPGCDNCYAMRQAHRFNTPSERSPFHGLTVIRKGKVDWTGRAVFVPGMLDQPLRWRKPRRIFVNSMSDLFHESLSNEEIAAVFGVMAVCPQHTFQVLTKRPKRAREWFAWTSQLAAGNAERGSADSITRVLGAMAHLLAPSDATAQAQRTCHAVKIAWPLPNVWLGVSVEDQKTADARVPLLRGGCPAAVQFISAEPLLGPLDLSDYLSGGQTLHVCLDIKGALRNGGNSLDGFTGEGGRALSRDEAKQELQRSLATGARVLPMGDCDDFSDQTGCRGHRKPSLDWVIIGGESGHGARPCASDWLQSIIEQCRGAGVAVFVKQLGSCSIRDARAVSLDGRFLPDFRRELTDRKGGDWDEWPSDLQVREFPECPA